MHFLSAVLRRVTPGLLSLSGESVLEVERYEANDPSLRLRSVHFQRLGFSFCTVQVSIWQPSFAPFAG